jgi:hypothetical protein
MDDSIMNIEQAVAFLGVTEKTLIKLLRVEQVPARKIGREWRFSKAALTAWIAGGNSLDYINSNGYYRASTDDKGKSRDLLDKVGRMTQELGQGTAISQFVGIGKTVTLPENTTLRVSYKQQRDIEKLEFKFFWPLREENQALSRGSGENGTRGSVSKPEKNPRPKTN